MRVWFAALGMFCALCGATYGAPSAATQDEIAFLLNAIAASKCSFIRNGQSYDAPAAVAHLRLKYERLAAQNQIRDADEFIAKAATRSSLTGRPYEIQCPGAPPVPTGQWLQDALLQHRASPTPVTQRLTP